MKKLLVISLFFVLAIVWATQVFPSSGGAHGPVHGPDMKFVYAAINFVLLVILLYFVIRKPAREFFRNRSLKTKLDIDNAKKAYDEHYRTFEEIETKLKNADVKSKELINSVRQDAEQEKARIVAMARELSEKIKKDAKRIADHELVKAKQELKLQAVDLAEELAIQKIKEQMTAQIQNRLSGEFVSQVQKAELS